MPMSVRGPRRSAASRVLAMCVASWAPAFGQTAPDPSGVITKLRASTVTPQFGERFELTIERSWPRAQSIAAFDAVWLAPLHLEPVDDQRSQREERTVETRRYRATAFALGALVVPARHAPGLGDVTPLTLDVGGRLDPANPGPAELSSDLIGDVAVSSRGIWVGLIGAGVLALGVAWRSTRRRTPAPPPAIVSPPRPSPYAVARERLVALRSRAIASERDIDAFHVDAAHLVREFLAATSLPSAMEWTTEEIARWVGGVGAASGSGATAAVPVLRAADLVMFARGESTPSDRARMLDRIESLLGANGSSDGATT